MLACAAAAAAAAAAVQEATLGHLLLNFSFEIAVVVVGCCVWYLAGCHLHPIGPQHDMRRPRAAVQVCVCVCVCVHHRPSGSFVWPLSSHHRHHHVCVACYSSCQIVTGSRSDGSDGGAAVRWMMCAAHMWDLCLACVELVGWLVVLMLVVVVVAVVGGLTDWDEGFFFVLGCRVAYAMCTDLGLG